MTRRRISRLLLAALLFLLAACTSLTGKPVPDATIEKPAMLGPYSELSGRLLVMEPRRRWQVLIQWHAERLDIGWLRLTHAASNTVIELRWQHQNMQMRSSNASSWQHISRKELAEQGIVLPPRQLALLLLGQTPEHFVQKPATGHDDIIWESRGVKPFIRLQWQASSRRLSMTDMTHGRRAILIIERAKRPETGSNPAADSAP